MQHKWQNLGQHVWSRMRFFTREAFTALLRSFGITSLSVLTIGIALATFAAFIVLVANLRRVAEDLGQDVDVFVYLSPAVTDAKLATIQAELAQWTEIAAVRFVSPAKGLEEFRASLGQDAVILEGLPAEVLPPSFELRLRRKPWQNSEISALGRKLERIPYVSDVHYGQEDIQRVGRFLKIARGGVLVLGVALCLGIILIISNTIRLTVYARKDEIAVMMLVGATQSFVRTPLMLEGVIQGLLGGVVAMFVLLGLESGLRRILHEGLSLALESATINFVPAQLAVYVLLTGMVLGLTGSVLALGRFLRV